MRAWQSSLVDANGIRLHITRTGGDKPALVMAHGLSDDGLCWTPIADALSTEYDVILVDTRGHGRSDAPERGYDLRTLANDLHGVIQTLGVQKPIIVGHSLGAITTLLLAGLFPGTPGAILLEDPPAWWEHMPTTELPERAERMLDWVTQLKSKPREQIIAEGHAQHPTWSHLDIETLADAKLCVSLNAIENLFTPDHTVGVNWTETLPRIACPVLVMTADPVRGAILTSADVDALRVFVPHLCMEHIAQAGHNIHRDQFGLFLEIVRANLAAMRVAGSVP